MWAVKSEGHGSPGGEGGGGGGGGEDTSTPERPTEEYELLYMAYLHLPNTQYIS